MNKNSIILVLWTAFLLGVLLAPIGDNSIPGPLNFEYFDKVAHFCLFAVTGFLSVIGLNSQKYFQFRLLFGLVFGLFVAISTEFGQSLVSRDTSFYDLLADIIGLCAGLTLYSFFYYKYTVR